MTPNDAYEFFVELVSQVFHADVLITEQAQRIEADGRLTSGRRGPRAERWRITTGFALVRESAPHLRRAR